MRRLLALLVAAVALVPVGSTSGAPTAGACHPGPPPWDDLRSDQRLRMDDGVEIAVTLHVPFHHGCGSPSLFRNGPAVMLFHGLGGTRRDMDPLAAQYLVREGYAALTFDARAHGDSGGLFDLDGPREIADVRALFDWLAARPEVDATKIGAFGISYGGGAVWRATVSGVPFAAIEPAITWTDLYPALAPQNLAKSGVIFQLSRLVPAERYTPEAARLLQDALASRNLGAIRTYVNARSSLSALAGVRVPTFMLQGRRDFLFDVDQALAAYRRLAGPKRLYVGDLGHPPASNPAAERNYYLTQGRMWFDRFLKGMPNGIDTRPPIELARDPWTGKTVSFRRVPPTRRLGFTLPGRTTIGPSGKVVRAAKLPRGIQETYGAPSVRATLTARGGWSHVVAVLSARTPAGGETVVSEGGSSLRAGTRAVTIRLMNEVTAIPAGSRLRLTLAATSTAQDPDNLLYLVGVGAGARLTVGEVRLSVPVLRTPISRP